MVYLDKDDLELAFEIIQQHFSRVEEVPEYESQKQGVEKILGVIERSKSRYYKSLLEKVSFLFIQVNKGHFFSNGNKRIALVLAMAFLISNDHEIDALNPHIPRGLAPGSPLRKV